jgi:hypothetical protein
VYILAAGCGKGILRDGPRIVLNGTGLPARLPK